MNPNIRARTQFLRDLALKAIGGDAFDEKRIEVNTMARRAIYDQLTLEGFGVTDISKAVGVNHATVIVAKKTHSDRLSADKKYREIFNNFKQSVITSECPCCHRPL